MSDYSIHELQNTYIHLFDVVEKFGDLFDKDYLDALKVGYELVGDALSDAEHFADKMGAT